MRVLELISVFPVYIQGEVMKQIHALGLSRGVVNFDSLASEFMSSTAAFMEEDLSPGGFYTGVWCRDASYIVNELLLMDKRALAFQSLEWIWHHQIQLTEKSNEVVHGRGSPQMNYQTRRLPRDNRNHQVEGNDILLEFDGALPTSIQNGYCEIYGRNPDIDSTGLVISVSCKCCLANEQLSRKLMPKIRKAIGYLESRDRDGDLLLEQDPNEDWMDRMLRAGKLVYNQAIWIMALHSWSELLRHNGREDEAEDASRKADLVIDNVEAKLWRDDIGCYADLSHNASIDKTITEDICLYLLAVSKCKHKVDRVTKALDTLERVIWKESGPSCQEPPASVTVPPILGPYKYQNGGFWPWICALEVMTRISYGQYNKAKILLEEMLPLARMEWVDPYNTRAGGAFPFRTGIAATRTCLRTFLESFRDAI